MEISVTPKSCFVFTEIVHYIKKVHCSFLHFFFFLVCSNGQGDLCFDNADYVSQCTKWAEEGECIKNKGWMSKNCYKSCYQVMRN